MSRQERIEKLRREYHAAVKHNEQAHEPADPAWDLDCYGHLSEMRRTAILGERLALE